MVKAESQLLHQNQHVKFVCIEMDKNRSLDFHTGSLTSKLADNNYAILHI